MAVLVLSVVWLAAETLLDNVGQTATSVPLIRRKATATWIFIAFTQKWQNEKLQDRCLKCYRKVTIYYNSRSNKKSHWQGKKMFC